MEVHDSRAVIEDPHTVRLLSTGQTLTAKYILVAVGASPNVDDGLPGGEHVITSNEAFHLAELPSKIVVAGGGYIAVEFAGIFNGLGVDTTLIYRGEEILRGFDGELRTAVRQEMEKKGIKVVLEDREGGRRLPDRPHQGWAFARGGPDHVRHRPQSAYP